MKSRASGIIAIVAMMWCLEVANAASGHALNRFGLYPRDWSQWWGIYTSPFLHTGLQHLLVNTFPFIILSGLVAVRGFKYFIAVSFLIVTLGGIGVWQLARSAIHVGASGWIFGLFGFLLARAWFERSLSAIAAGLTTGFLYGGMIWGVLPLRQGVSWEGHLFGLIAGLLTAMIFHHAARRANS